jgi:uncharacterized repeat protein (TIGR01451 family)
MRRIAITLTVLAFVAGAFSCSSDAPTPPKAGGPGGPGTTGSTALQIRLFTSNPNPPAGTCTLIQAIVTLNGNNVPDGTGVAFSTDFGVFGQNGLPLISIVTQNGAAVTALCSADPGTAVVRAMATSGGQTGSASITIAFQPATGAGPFVSFCSPSFGPITGGTSLVIHGGRFFGNASTTRVVFVAAGIQREGVVTAVTATQITVQTPGFPELTSPSVPVDIQITLGTNTGSPVTLSLPNCFAFGTTLSSTPTITAVLPSSGVNEGNTRVTIIGSGFQAPVQVFFGNVEATVVSVSFNQIVVLTPAAFGAGRDNLNKTVDVRVHNVTSGLDATLTAGYRYVQPVQLISISNNQQRVDLPFTPVTIFGHGFQAPVAVTLAGRPATIISVSESELVVLPSRPQLTGCTDVSGAVAVTNINSGDSASGLTFIYLVAQTKPVITSVVPTSGPKDTVVTITGFNLPVMIADASVTFGARNAVVNSASPTGTTLIVTAPDFLGTAAPPLCPTGIATDTPVNFGAAVDVTVTNRLSTCSATFSSFQPQVKCVQPTPTPATPTPVLTLTPTPTATPAPPADLSVVKSAPASAATGTQITYSIVASNAGPGSVNVTVTDPLPGGTTFASCTPAIGTCSGPTPGTNGTVVANLGQMGPGGSASITITVNITATAGTSISNTATVAPVATDPNPANNSSSATTLVTP